MTVETTLQQLETTMTAQSITELTRESMERMSKKELIENLTMAITMLNERKEQRSNKKFVVLEILKRGHPISILDIANELNISTKNVSSLLCYLRKDGITIHTNEKGEKYIVE